MPIMFRKLFCRRKDTGTYSPDLGIKPHAAAATLALSESDSPVERENAQAALFNKMFLAEHEQKMLKQKGAVAKIVRRQNAQCFRVERTWQHGDVSPVDSMIDDQGRDWSPAIVWADGLQSDPLYLDEDERESLTPPDWAVSTAIEAMERRYKPAMFDWLEPKRPSTALEEYEEGRFDGWCESLMDSVFGVAGKNNDGLIGQLDATFEHDDDNGVKVKMGEVKTQPRSDIVFHQAPAIAENCAVIRNVRGGVVTQR